MKLIAPTIPTLVILAVFSASGFALTVTQKVDSVFVRANPTIDVTTKKQQKGQIDFTVTLKTKQPRYVVAHLKVVDTSDQTIAASDTPTFTRNGEHRFQFSMLPQYVEHSKFTLGVSHFIEDDGQATPVPGTTDYEIVLSDFVR